jgi:hypothetical protein
MRQDVPDAVDQLPGDPNDNFGLCRNASPSDSVACLDFRTGITPNPARPWSGPMKLLGTRLGLRQRPEGRMRMSEAAGRVARASGRGRRRVNNFIQAVKGMCKKSTSNRVKSPMHAALIDNSCVPVARSTHTFSPGSSRLAQKRKATPSAGPLKRRSWTSLSSDWS